MSVLPKLNRLQETWKWAQPTGCPLSHWCPGKLRSSYGVSQLMFKLREISSHENWYIYSVRKSRDQWLCTQAWILKRSVHKMWDIHAWWLCLVHDRSRCSTRARHNMICPLPPLNKESLMSNISPCPDTLQIHLHHTLLVPLCHYPE